VIKNRGGSILLTVQPHKPNFLVVYFKDNYNHDLGVLTLRIVVMS